MIKLPCVCKTWQKLPCVCSVLINIMFFHLSYQCSFIFWNEPWIVSSIEILDPHKSARSAAGLRRQLLPTSPSKPPGIRWIWVTTGYFKIGSLDALPLLFTTFICWPIFCVSQWLSFDQNHQRWGSSKKKSGHTIWIQYIYIYIITSISIWYVYSIHVCMYVCIYIYIWSPPFSWGVSKGGVQKM